MLHSHRTLRALPALLALLLVACGGTATPAPSSTAPAPAASAPASQAASTAASAAPSAAAEASDAPSAATEASEAPSAAAEASQAAGGSRTIEHKYGTTTIEGTPERVVSVGFNDQDAILALGVVPVGIRDWYGDQPNAVWPWAQDKLGDAAPEVLPSTDLSYEQVAALQPDVIIGISSGMTEEQYTTLSEIAPTVPQSGEYIDYGVPWQEQQLVIGQALGLEAEAEQLVADVEARFAELRDAHPEWQGKNAAVAVSFNNQYSAYGPQDVRARLLSSLGFQTPPEIAELAGDSFFASISSERLDLLDTDLLVWGVSTDAERAAIESDPLVQQLAATQEGRSIFLNQELSGAASFSSVLSLPFLLDEMVPQLEQALGAGASAAASASASAGAGGGPVTVTDAEDSAVEIADTSRIVTVGGTVTEIVFALGAGSQVVAADTSSTYPEEATRLPMVGYQRQLAAEGVLALNPTLILTSVEAGPPEAVEQLKSSGVPVFVAPIEYSVDGTKQLITTLAEALGRGEQGAELIAQLDADLAEAEQVAAESSDRPRVLFLYARGSNTVSAAGTGTSAEQIISMAGGENAITEFADFKPLTAEAAAAAAPDVIVMFDSGLESLGGVDGLMQVPGVAQTPAGQQGRIVTMDGLYLLGFGPRLGAAARDLATELHAAAAAAP